MASIRWWPACWSIGSGCIISAAALVATPATSASLGERPSHPELLDWLADDFMGGGWKLKRLQRMIVTSTAYRQSSDAPRRAGRGRSGESLLGRMSVRRLEAETIRDALLAISGRLSAKMFRPAGAGDARRRGADRGRASTRATRPAGRRAKSCRLGEDEFRRSIYVQVRRSMPLGMLEPFDAADR